MFWSKPKPPNRFTIHITTQITTTPLRIDLMLDCIGMNRFTSHNRIPTTTNVMTSCMSGISCSPFEFLKLTGIRRESRSACPYPGCLARLLLVCSYLGNRACMARILNRLHESEGRFRGVDVTCQNAPEGSLLIESSSCSILFRSTLLRARYKSIASPGTTICSLLLTVERNHENADVNSQLQRCRACLKASRRYRKIPRK